MVHPLVEQLRFTRSEFQRALEGLGSEDAVKRVGPANCIAWNVGHLAWQEQRYWLLRGQDRMLRLDVNEQFAYGAAASPPPLADAWAAWREITSASDAFLDEFTTETLVSKTARSKPLPTTWANLLQPVIYHYWYHTGENMGIRQALGHNGLQGFVGDIDGFAPYRAD